MATAQKTKTVPASGGGAPAPIDPPERLLMGPGPSNPDPRVLEAMTANPVGHLDPYFVKVMDETMDALRKVFRTTNHHTIPISATGSAGLESITLNLLEPGDEAIVIVNGYFGARLAEMARRAGANVRVLESQPGEVADPAAVDKLLREKAANVVAFVHVETTSGARQPIEPIVEVARKHGALVAMDCVTSLGGLPLDIDALGVDAAGSCSQKCIGAPPGLAPITISARAMAKARARKAKPQTWYFDYGLLFQYWGEESASRTRAFHHTAPIAAVYGFHEALRIVLEEGLDARYARHESAHDVLVRGLERLGLSLFTPAANRCATINLVSAPAGLDEAKLRRRLLDMGVEMGGGLGTLAGKVWRIGVMGYNAQPARVEKFLGALEEALRAEGWK